MFSKLKVNDKVAVSTSDDSYRHLGTVVSVSNRFLYISFTDESGIDFQMRYYVANGKLAHRDAHSYERILEYNDKNYKEYNDNVFHNSNLEYYLNEIEKFIKSNPYNISIDKLVRIVDIINE